MTNILDPVDPELVKAIEAGSLNVAPTPAKPLNQIDTVDTSTWTEYPKGFFEKPLIKSNIAQTSFVIQTGPESTEQRRMISPCQYMSIRRNTPEEAVQALREHLLPVANKTHVIGFMVKPSTIAVTGDLSGSTSYVAFCFLHIYIDMEIPEVADEMLNKISWNNYMTAKGFKGFAPEGALSGD